MSYPGSGGPGGPGDPAGQNPAQPPAGGQPGYGQQPPSQQPPAQPPFEPPAQTTQSPAYGQQPGPYGQQPGPYGQQPGAYGQQPGAYGQPPVPPDYGSPSGPQPPPTGSNKTPLIAAIVVLLLVAGGVTAFLLLKSDNKPKHKPGPTPIVTTSAPSTSTPSPSTSTPSQTTATSPTSGTVSGAPVAIASGVSVVPAAGWTISSHGASSIKFRNPAGDAYLFVSVGRARGPQVIQVLNADISVNAHGPIYSNVQLTSTPTDHLTNNSNGPFDHFAEATFLAKGPNGETFKGLYGELLNTHTLNSAFFIAYASSYPAYQNALVDFGTMIHSLNQ